MVAARHAMLATRAGPLRRSAALIDEVAEQGRRAGAARHRPADRHAARDRLPCCAAIPPSGERSVAQLRAFAPPDPGTFLRRHNGPGPAVARADGRGRPRAAARPARSCWPARGHAGWAPPRTSPWWPPRPGTRRCRGAAVCGARRLPGPAGRLGGREHGHRTGHALSRPSRWPARQARRRGRSAREDAAALERQIGALPWLAHTLAALADAHARRAGDGGAERAAECRRNARDIAAAPGHGRAARTAVSSGR